MRWTMHPRDGLLRRVFRQSDSFRLVSRADTGHNAIHCAKAPGSPEVADTSSPTAGKRVRARRHRKTCTVCLQRVSGHAPVVNLVQDHRRRVSLLTLLGRCSSDEAGKSTAAIGGQMARANSRSTRRCWRRYFERRCSSSRRPERARSFSASAPIWCGFSRRGSSNADPRTTCSMRPSLSVPSRKA